MTGAADQAGAAGQDRAGDPAGLAVSYLVGSAAGGTGRHVAMLAGGCAARGATVHLYGPATAGPPQPGPAGAGLGLQ